LLFPIQPILGAVNLIQFFEIGIRFDFAHPSIALANNTLPDRVISTTNGINKRLIIPLNLSIE